ncbi:MAG TPA: stalk domain-containing protein [Pseudobacteroides sp.]|uniref:stalk domain-containing protein n=1 Tax=Pseudobacteroides sp. TaxID=1968840 RepID=UPI002F956466
MKRLNKIGDIALGMILTFIVCTATPAFAAATKEVVKQITACFTSGGKPITVYVNGVKIDKDSNGKAVTPFAVDGTTYLPVRAIADALGKDVTWDGTTASVKITDKVVSSTDTTSTTSAVTPTPATTPIPDTTASFDDQINALVSKITVTKGKDGSMHDSMDYKFVLDKDVVGEWQQIDFVASPDQLDSTDITRRKYVQLGIHNFYDDGREVSYCIKSDGGMTEKWTKGYVFGSMDGITTISSYVIKQLDGKTFMFIQWKCSDYTVRGQKPNYYVYVKTSDTPDPDFAKK